MQVIVNLMITRMSHFMTTQFTQRNTLDHLVLNYNVCTQPYCIQPIIAIGNRFSHDFIATTNRVLKTVEQ